MSHRSRTSAAVLALLLAAAATPATAAEPPAPVAVAGLAVTEAGITAGRLVIVGRTTTPGTAVTIDGTRFTVTSGKDGAFRLSGFLHPDTCRVVLKAATAVLPVQLANCGRRGPAGPTGPRGGAGAVGDAGPQGVAGPAGEAGPRGPDGPEGLPGPDGAEGRPGPEGATGPRGATGPAGPDGSFAGRMFEVSVRPVAVLDHGSPGVAVVYAGVGNYLVRFPRDVTACTFTATSATAFNSKAILVKVEPPVAGDARTNEARVRLFDGEPPVAELYIPHPIEEAFRLFAVCD
ncbi:collagen-like protein [Oharaeibacter diazotrophicus]|uniref:Collagen triple helix repeat protein n=1 Tax=Oharaeibacter diazotrophicus TaxID=1920512 RepID=A0A4R6RCR0_9HYPH|nr:collagen-like protein [Oharaeibacter diazotrophicus]TDP83991.1 collagen triple helix repeat protein [Oharaeibacter diazotrophicus]BBE73030.1 collagen triple helix repeat protein with 20 copies [Pleomorphomonas sp. SM30]GLS74818.1 hypothetical protein GCM10007904_01530 [Oharaeibacter diazotrophicus]